MSNVSSDFVAINMAALDSSIEHFVLSNGVRIPKLGLGTTYQQGGVDVDTMIYAVKDCGYRLIDTAQKYGTEKDVATTVQKSDVPREKLFITTKLPSYNYGYQSAIDNFYVSCHELQCEIIDLYLLHWPDVTYECSNKHHVRAETWKALEQLYEKGLCRAIGVSNFLVPHLEHFLCDCKIMPHVNQIEYNPYQNNKHLVQYCKDKGIFVQGWSSLAKGQILDRLPVVDIATRLSKTPAQILLRWSLQNGVGVIPKSRQKARVLENSQIFDFTIPDKEMSILDNLHEDLHVSVIPSTVIF